MFQALGSAAQHGASVTVPTTETQTLVMRAPCTRCSAPEGRIVPTNGQNCVFCSACNKYCYNAPKTETGERTRSVQTVHSDIRPKQRARILIRANGLCELCGAHGVTLHVSHLLSVKDGLAYDLTEAEINSDDNLAAFCEECNLGMGAQTITPRLFAAILRRHAK